MKDSEDLENQLALLGDKTKQENEEEKDKKSNFQQNVWPWEGVCTKLKSALTEMCVLSDVISISKDKRYMVLDPAQQDTPEQRHLVQLFSKKRVINCWSLIIFLIITSYCLYLGINSSSQHTPQWWGTPKTFTIRFS